MERDIVKEVLEYNTEEGDLKKLMEEMAELNEIIVKKYVKQDPHKPPMSKIIEEVGDVYLRLLFLVTRYDIIEDVERRMNDKADKIFEYIDEGKYKGGV